GCVVVFHVAGVSAPRLCLFPLVLPSFAAGLLVPGLALGLRVAGSLAAVLPGVTGILPVVPPILALLRPRGLRIARGKRGERSHGERQRQSDHPNSSPAEHLPSFSPHISSQ